MPGERRVWLEQLSRRLDTGDPEHRRLCHQLLVAVTNNDDGAAERAAAELSRLAGVEPPESG